MMLETVNWWHVIVGAIAAMVIGTVWYMPMIFGKAWMTDLGKKMPEGGSAPMGAMAVMAIGSLVMSYVMAQFVIKMNVMTVTDGLWLGFWIWLGFNAAYLIGMTMFENRTWRLFFINSGNMLVTYLVVAAILAGWK